MNKSDLKKYLQNWEISNKALTDVRKNELANFSYIDNLAKLDDMLEYACTHLIPRKTTGLIEQQRYFQKFRN